MKPKITPRRGNTNNTYIIKAEVEAEVIMVEYTKETQEEFKKELLDFLNPAYAISGIPSKWSVYFYDDKISLSGWTDLRTFKKGTFLTKDAKEFKGILI